jgi:GDP-4-dehydro-6-deoxy-D-mannose reductase
MLDVLLSQTEAQITVEQDPSRMRPSDVRLLWANVDKFKAATGWEPTIPFEKTMADLLEYWRDRIYRASPRGDPGRLSATPHGR